MAGGFFGLRDLTLFIPSSPSTLPAGGFIGILPLQFCSVQGDTIEKVGASPVMVRMRKDLRAIDNLREEEEFITVFSVIF